MSIYKPKVLQWETRPWGSGGSLVSTGGHWWIWGPEMALGRIPVVITRSIHMGLSEQFSSFSIIKTCCLGIHHSKTRSHEEFSGREYLYHQESWGAKDDFPLPAWLQEGIPNAKYISRVLTPPSMLPAQGPAGQRFMAVRDQSSRDNGAKHFIILAIDQYL